MIAFTRFALAHDPFLMGVVQRLRDLLRPPKEQPAPAWAYAPAPTGHRPRLPREPRQSDDWRPLWRPGQQPKRPTGHDERDE